MVKTHGSNVGLKCCVASNEGQDPPYIYIYIYECATKIDFVTILIKLKCVVTLSIELDCNIVIHIDQIELQSSS